MKDEKEVSPAEEERLAAIARGDVVEEEDEEVLEEEVLEEEEDEPGAPVDEDLQVPKARFDDARKAAKAENDALKARIAALENATKKDVITVDMLEAEIEELEDKVDTHLLEGEVAEAKAIRKTLNAKRNALIDQRIAEKSTAMGKAAVEQVRYDAQLAAFEAKFPVMNPDAVDFSKDVSDEIDMLMGAFEAKGMSLVASLNKAVHYVLGNKAEKPVSEDNKSEKVKLERKLNAQKKALDTVNKTPTNLDGVGRNSDKAGRDDGLPSPLKMSQAQFDKLTEVQKAELRDDTLKVH